MKALRLEIVRRSVAVGHDTLSCAVEPVSIGPCRNGALERKMSKRIDVEAILDAAKRFDEVRLGDGKTHVQAGQAPRFRKGLYDDQVFVALHEADSAVAPKSTYASSTITTTS